MQIPLAMFRTFLTLILTTLVSLGCTSAFATTIFVSNEQGNTPIPRSSR